MGWRCRGCRRQVCGPRRRLLDNMHGIRLSLVLNNMWGIVDGNPEQWVGYLGAADFRLSAGNVVTYNRILVHWVSDKAQSGCHHTLPHACLHQARGCAMPGPDTPPVPPGPCMLHNSPLQNSGTNTVSSSGTNTVPLSMCFNCEWGHHPCDAVCTRQAACMLRGHRLALGAPCTSLTASLRLHKLPSTRAAPPWLLGSCCPAPSSLCVWPQLHVPLQLLVHPALILCPVACTA